MNRNIRKNTNLLMIIGVILVVSSIVGSAQTFISSTNVLEIDGSGVSDVGGPVSPTLFTTGGLFDAGVINWYQIPVGSFSSVGSNDTVILFQINTVTELTAVQEATLVSFVTGGGKLIIWDSDAGATTSTPNDYNWLPTNLIFNTSVPGQLGASGGVLIVSEENDLSSNNLLDPKFINTTRLVNFSDAVGDANVVKTNGTDWCQDMFAQNKATPPQSGPGHMYSRLGGSVGNGFIVYSALDWDDATGGGIGGDELRKMMQFELEVNHTSDLPCTVTVAGPSFTVAKDFRFTDVNFYATPALLGKLLPHTDSNYTVKYVLKPKDGTVSSTNPGQLYGVITINGTGVSNVTVNDTFGTQFNVNPAKLGGGVEILRVNKTTGVATILTNTPQITFASVDNTLNKVNLAIELATPLAADEKIMVYIKFMTSLKGLPPDFSKFVNNANAMINNGSPITTTATIKFV